MNKRMTRALFNETYRTAVLNEALFYAVSKSDFIFSTLAVTKGANANLKRDGEYLIIKAAKWNNVLLLKVLLEAGASVNSIDAFGNMPIHICASCGNLECVSLLVAYKSPINICNYFDKTPLMIAAHVGSLPVVEFLLNVGATLSYKVNKKNESELVLASQMGNLPVVEHLLRVGDKSVNRLHEILVAMRRAFLNKHNKVGNILFVYATTLKSWLNSPRKQ